MSNNITDLENNMVRYQELIRVTVKENQDPFVYFDKNIILRKNVSNKIVVARTLLQNSYPDLSLEVFCGFRSIETQTKRFLKRLKILSKNYFLNPVGLYESVHRSVAVPNVAGHPTGGAIDVLIKNIKTGKIIDFGSKIYDYSTKKHYVFYKNISSDAKKNRFLLRRIMLSVGFAPYDGEFWHFSYGDREWAYYYKKKFAIYEQKSIKEINFSS